MKLRWRLLTFICRENAFAAARPSQHWGRQLNAVSIAYCHVAAMVVDRAKESDRFVAAARMARLVVKYLADPGLRLLPEFKNNLRPDGTGLAFRIFNDGVGSRVTLGWLACLRKV